MTFATPTPRDPAELYDGPRRHGLKPMGDQGRVGVARPRLSCEGVGALSRGAFVAYNRISDYHDFVLQLEPTATTSNRRVGLWAKRYMSDPDSDLQYLGTMTTRELFDTVVGDRLPGFLPETARNQKLEVETKAKKEFNKVAHGPFKDQFSTQRLADAMALCDRCWGHFAAADGQMPADGSRQWLPRQLGAALRECGKRARSIRLARESPHGTAAASLQARCVIRGGCASTPGSWRIP